MSDDSVSQDSVLDLLATELFAARVRNHGARAEQHLAIVAFRLLTGRQPTTAEVKVYVKALATRADGIAARKAAAVHEALSRS